VAGQRSPELRRGGLHVEGRSSCGEYIAGSKTGYGRDLALRAELAEEFARVGRAYREAGRQLGCERLLDLGTARRRNLE
jgi:hypothetical protein